MKSPVTLYLFGCGAAAVLYLLAQMADYSINWITKRNIENRNLKKLESQEFTPLARFGLHLLVFVVCTLLSWLAAVLFLVGFPALILAAVRDVVTFASVPPKVKELRYPLRNNVNLAREIVWAHKMALDMVSGQIPATWADLLEQLSAIAERHPGFDKMVALRRLEDLRVVHEQTWLSIFPERANQTGARDDYLRLS